MVPEKKTVLKLEATYMWKIATWNHMMNQGKETESQMYVQKRINKRKKDEKEKESDGKVKKKKALEKERKQGKEQAGETERGKDCEIIFFL